MRSSMTMPPPRRPSPAPPAARPCGRSRRGHESPPTASASRFPSRSARPSPTTASWTNGEAAAWAWSSRPRTPGSAAAWRSTRPGQGVRSHFIERQAGRLGPGRARPARRRQGDVQPEPGHRGRHPSRTPLRPAAAPDRPLRRQRLGALDPWRQLGPAAATADGNRSCHPAQVLLRAIGVDVLDKRLEALQAVLIDRKDKR
jgi:hypothetical protein